MTHRITRAAAAVAVVAGALLTTACFVPPAPAPQQPQTPVQTEAPATPPPTSTPSAPPAQTQAAPEPMHELVAEGQDGSTWSFEVSDVSVVETDSLDAAAEPGRQLIEVTVEGQLLAGEPDFYRAFHMYLVDADGGEWGLSSGTQFYAEDDLFTTGRQPEFTGVGIYHVPADLTYEVVRFSTDDGWTQDVEP